ncbi:DNA-binding protein [Geodermatophilus sp. SYSU D00815]
MTDDDLPRSIGRPASGALREAGITRLSQLTALRERELLALHGVGPKAVRLLREALADRGLSFAG